MHSWQFRYSVLILAAALFVLVAQMGYLGSNLRTVVDLPGWIIVDDFFLGYSWADDSGLFLIVRVVVSWVFWFCLLWALAQFVRRRFVGASSVVLIVLATLGFLAFRTTVAGSYTFYRSWGFVTHATSDSNADGMVDVENWYSWSRPLIDAHSLPLRTRSDQNYDGQWDTWVEYESNTLRIDTNGDGVSDVTLEADFDGYKNARELRGFGW